MLMLKELRKREGWTQKQIAQKLGVTQNNYSYMENGKIKIADNYIKILCELYHCSKEYLLGESGQQVKIWDKEYTEFRRETRFLEMIDLILSGADRFTYYYELSELDKQSFVYFLLHNEQSLRELREAYKKVEEVSLFKDGKLWYFGSQPKKDNNEQ